MTTTATKTSITFEHLRTITARKKLQPRGRPYCVTVAPGVQLGFRALDATTGAGSWAVKRSRGAGKSAFSRFAAATDSTQPKGNGTTVLDFVDAMELARKLGRGAATGPDGAKPITVAQALDNYEADLVLRNGDVANAEMPRYHLQFLPSLRDKLVALLTRDDITAFITYLLNEAKVQPSTVNRIMKAFKAALNLAARSFPDQIKNAAAWKVKALPKADRSRNIILTEQQVDAVVNEACGQSPRYGTWIWTLAETGTRHSQAWRIAVADLRTDGQGRPYLMIPKSMKGNSEKGGEQTPRRISPALAARLKAEAAGRGAHEPLLRDDEGNTDSQAGLWDRRVFPQIAAKLGLPLDPQGKLATVYCLRHTSIVHAILGGRHIQRVAIDHDTSVGQITKTYTKELGAFGLDLDHDNVPAINVPATADNVVPITRRAA